MSESVRPLRADAQANRDRILAAARDAFVERGASVPLDDIARRAGIGIGTLYRRFPDRPALMRAVVLDAIRSTADEAQRAAEEEKDPFAALVRYMHRTLDLRVGAVIPALLDVLPIDDAELEQARTAGSEALQRMVARAHRKGALRKDVSAGDIGTLIVRLSRPLPGPFPREVNDDLGHRHLDLLVDGLSGKGRLSGPELSLHDLQRMSRSSRRRPARGVSRKA